MNGELKHGSETTVGTLLRASRLRRDENLREVAHMLRVRFLYLEAIEEGRYDDLPGNAYAIGFIRAYSEYLGLDSEEVVRRYKAETLDGRDTPQLVFPSPIPENSVPGGAILFIGAVVAILAYGSWYVSSTQDEFLTELVSPIPDRLASLSRDGKKGEMKKDMVEPAKKPSPVSAIATDSPVEKPNDKPQEKFEPAPNSIETSAGGSAAAEKAKLADKPVSSAAEKNEVEKKIRKLETVKAPDASASAPLVVQPKKESALVEAARSATDTSAAEPTPQAAVTSNKPADTKVINNAPPTQPVATQSPEVKKPVISQVAAVTATEGKSRILVRAKDDSWILIRDGGSNQLLTRKLLRAGETYRVPNRPGLTLQAGNAGVLEITVDGETVPTIGAVGAVLRSVALDANRLREGKAVAP